MTRMPLKRLSIAAFCLIPVMSVMTAYAQTTTIPFTDYLQSDYKDAIEYLYNEGIIDGYPDNTFKPKRTINRAEFMKILIESNFDPTEFDTFGMNSCFPDVTADQWYTEYVCFGKSRGIIEGYEDGNFRPEQSITLNESLKMMYETIGVAGPDPNAIFKFKYYSPAARAGYIPDDLKGEYDTFVTRGEVSEILYRILIDPDKKIISDISFGLTVHRQLYDASCAMAALSTALSQQVEVPEEDIINRMVAMGLYPNNPLEHVDGGYVWDDPEKVFVGDYNGVVSIYMYKLAGYGFLEGPLEQLAKVWAPNSEKFTGASLKFITGQIEEGHPLIVFANVDAQDGSVVLTEAGPYAVSWKIKGTDTIVNAPMYKHNLVIEGYKGTPDAPEVFYMIDPFYGKKLTMTPDQLTNLMRGYDFSGVVIKF